MKELLQLAARSRARIACLSLLGVLSGACGAALVWVISETLSGSFPSAPWLFVPLVTVALGTRIAFLSLLGRVHQHAVFALRQELARRILATPLRALEDTGVSHLQATLTVDVMAISEGFRLLPSLFINLTSGLGCLSYLAWLSPVGFLGLLAMGGLGLLSYWLPTQRAVRTAERARAWEDRLFEHIRALTEGVKELALHGGRRRAFVDECFDPAADRLRQLSVRIDDIYGATASWGLFLFFVLIGMVLFVLPSLLSLTGRVLTGYALAILYLQQPLAGVLEALPFIHRGGVACRKIAALGLLPASAVESLPRQPARAQPFERIDFCDVGHRYHRDGEDRPFELGPLNFTLRRGELVFLVGGNGSGKTTLAKLLTGLYAPERGEIRIDGQPVTEDDCEDYRARCSAVFSDFFLFDSLLGVPSDPSSRARMDDYLVRLELDHKVSIRDGRFSTTLLSQGQRKRLALLAAYMEDRPLYVFDEWAADQDPAFKAVFYEELLPELQRLGRTVVVITHDDKYFHAADRVLRLEFGKLHASSSERTLRSEACASAEG
jgi:putative pyoverdin transport system ATP-binding/permease protein